ncbi:hypothetical protein SS50377_28269 [Spironucleus salmonicida]|uniref:Uncharacterized protein n=1 Tax=Spironucleus salmonicida TaxID=348837 RepID=V6LUY9_9EUKA|nr:hypothetical protein SS50377_28269 [Spironucleus salmonicida]|eukprot:EST48447.1 Hypothetical protein SS50377_11397 [Spironucleus salmonicida]
MEQIITALKEFNKISFQQLSDLALINGVRQFSNNKEIVAYFLNCMKIYPSDHQILYMFISDTLELKFYVTTKIEIRQVLLENIPLVLFINFVSKEKNYYNFINLFLQLQFSEQDLIIEIISEQEEQSGLISLLEKLKLENQDTDIKKSYQQIFGKNCGVINSSQALKLSLLNQFQKVEVVRLQMKNGTVKYVKMKDLENYNQELLDIIVRLLE